MSLDTSASEQLMAAMRRSIAEFAATHMRAEVVQWETTDVEKPEAVSTETTQETSTRVETKFREKGEELRGAGGWRWWEDQEREPSGIPEGGEFMSFPEGHWRQKGKRRRRRKGRRIRRARRPLEIAKGRVVRRLRRRVMRHVRPMRLRRLKRRLMPRQTMVVRRARRLAGLPTARGIRRRLGIRPGYLTPQVGERLTNRMVRAMTDKMSWK